MALTATANLAIRAMLIKTLEMKGCFVLSHNPNKINIYYEVVAKTDLKSVLSPIVFQLALKQRKADWQILFAEHMMIRLCCMRLWYYSWLKKISCCMTMLWMYEFVRSLLAVLLQVWRRISWVRVRVKADFCKTSRVLHKCLHSLQTPLFKTKSRNSYFPIEVHFFLTVHLKPY